MKMEQSVPKRRNIQFRRRGIAYKKAYNNIGCNLSKQNHFSQFAIQPHFLRKFYKVTEKPYYAGRMSFLLLIRLSVN